MSNLILISADFDVYYASHTWFAISDSVIALSIATNAVTTMMIAYKLWYVAVYQTRGASGAHHEGNSRDYRTFILNTFGPTRRKDPVQTILIFLIESGLVYLGFQVGSSGIVLGDAPTHVLTFLTDTVLYFRRACAPRSSSFICNVRHSGPVFFSRCECCADRRCPSCLNI